MDRCDHWKGISVLALLTAGAAPALGQEALPTIEVGAPTAPRASVVAGQPSTESAGAPESEAQRAAEEKFDTTQKASSSQFTTGQELNAVPFSRPGEALENAVPGLLVTQHSGEGKANQYQMRGFQLDHGTDFAIDIDGVPLNMPTHGHGQGYADANFLIPELFDYVVGKKGPYYADEGDFSAAGVAHIHYKDDIPGGLFSATVGSFDYGRLLGITSNKVAGGTLLSAAELGIYNGPWTVPDEVHRINGVLRWTQGTYDNGVSVDAMAYANRWHASNQIPERAVSEGVISLFGNINPTDRGDTTRFSLSGRWAETNANSHSWIEAYAIHTTLDLYNDFDYYLAQPLLGDQFRQFDRRTILGLKAEHGWNYTYAGFPIETRVGVQSRYDDIRVGIQDTYNRTAFQTLTNDAVDQGTVALWTDTTVHWTPWLRTVTGIRGDYFAASVGDYQNPTQAVWIAPSGVPVGIPSFINNPWTLPGYWGGVAGAAPALIWTGPWNSGSKTAAMDSPKFSLILGPWNKTEFFINAGEGFHSVDARATVSQLNPLDGSTSPKEPFLVKARGVEVGARTKFIEGLDSTLTFWGLDFDSESQFDGDTGQTLFGRPSQRYGIEWTNHYTPYSWLHFDGDLAVSHARSRGWDVPQTVAYAQLVTPQTIGYFAFLGNAPGNYIPEAPPILASISVEIGELTGWFGALKFRFKGSYPLTEDGYFRAPATGWLDLRGGYRWDNGLKLQVDVFNALNSKSDQITYAYGSLLPTDPLYAPCVGGSAPAAVCAIGIMDRHFKPMEPLAARVTLSGPLSQHAFDPLFGPGAPNMKSPLDFLAYAEDDQPAPRVTKGPPVVLPPRPVWTGFYVGLNAGVGFGADNNIYNAIPPVGPGYDPAVAFLWNSNLGNSNAAFLGGGQAGYNFQLARRVLAGVETDIQGALGGSGATNSNGSVPSFAFPGNFLLGSLTASQKLDFLGTARGRLGYLVTPSGLLYATAGLAYGHLTLNTSSEILNATPAGQIVSVTGGSSFFSDTRAGWTVGAGFEWMFLPNWSAKAEYLYYDLGSYNPSAVQTTIAVPSGAASISAASYNHGRANGQIVRAGLNFHFDWAAPAPVIAKY
jgi:opacity protein-like surface antigen